MIVSGSGLRLVLLPGSDGSGRLYERLIAVLEKRYDVQVVAYPQVSFQGYDDLARKVRDELPVGQDYVLVAESFAGPLAMKLAADGPRGLKALVLGASFCRFPLPGKPVLAGLLERFPAVLPPSAVLSFMLLGEGKDEALRKELSMVLADASPQVLKARVMAAMTVDAKDELKRIRVPILCLRATQDRLVHRSAASLMSSSNERVKLLDVVAPHFLFQLAADAAVEAINDFIERDVFVQV